MGKITDQTDGGAGLGTDEFVINRAGTDFKLNLTNVLKSVQDALTTEISDRTAGDLTLTNTKVDKAGDTLTGFLTTHADPTSTMHVANKQYVDVATTGKLSTAGGTMTGALVLSGDPTAALEPVTKQYLEGTNGVGGRWKNPTDQDCSANPNYPASSEGDTLRVSVAGKIGGASGVTVEVGDIILCITTSLGGDQATVGSEFTIIQTNTVSSSETAAGVIQVATQAETVTGTDDTKSITPLKLRQEISRVDGTYTRSVNGSGTVNMSLYDTMSGVWLLTGTTSAAVTVNLKEISTLAFTNMTINLKDAGLNAGINNITVNAGGSDTIEGSSSYVMNISGQSITLVNDGSTNWYIV